MTKQLMINHSRSKTKSINTLQSDLFPLAASELNHVHQYYLLLLSNLTNQYPYLSKLVFISLMLNTSSTIFTKHKDQVRDIYEQIINKLGLKQNIYYCDTNTFTTDVFKNKSNEQICLLFDMFAMDNKKSNQMREYIISNIIINVQTLSKQCAQSYLRKQFGMMVVDDSQTNFKQFINKIDQKTDPTNFKVKQFQDCLNINRKLAHQMANTGFIKAYLQAYQLLLSKIQIQFPHSRWKKTYEFTKIIGLSKTQHEFKSLCLVDCIFVPWFLSTSVEEYQKLTKINEEVILSLVIYYGVPKFVKHLMSHYFLSTKVKNSYYQKVLPLIDKHSFFFPCSKYPDLVTIEVQQQFCEANKIQFHYKVLGERKLMSDKHIEIDPQKQYCLSIDMKANIEIEVEVGIVCYDQKKELINTKSNHQKQKSAVTIKQIIGNQIILTDGSSTNLANWNIFDESSPMEDKLGSNFCIGIYPDKQSESVQYVLKSKSLTQSTASNCAYSSIDVSNNKIILSQHLILPLKHMIQKSIIVPNQTRFVNYINYPIYKLNKITPTQKWSKVEMKYTSNNNICNFKEEGAKYVRVMIIIEQHLSDKNEKILYFKNIEFNPF